MGNEIHVLSLDGGGSRGLMEAMNLDHIMKLATVMKNDPDRIRNIIEGDKMTKQETRDKIVEVINEVQPEEALHPTEAFQFIVGTSTGALIAFGLVGGKTVGNSEKRCPMMVEEIIELYKTVVPKIFQKSKAGKGFRDWCLRNVDKIMKNKSRPYTQDALKEEVDKMFGRSRTCEVNHNGVVAAAVARQFNEDAQIPDVLEIFDSKSDHPQLVSEVLLGSADAPIFFEIPTKIGGRNYIDGGVQGNCPLGKALPRATKIWPWPDHKIKSVLSLAPPQNKPSKKLTEKEKQWKKTVATLKYFPAQLTDGDSVYEDARNEYKDVFFQRTRPSLPTSMEFELDETDVEKMVVAMEKELRENPEYLYQIVDNAAVIASRSPDLTAQHLKMFKAIADSMIKRGQYKDGLYIAKTLLALNAIDRASTVGLHFTAGRCHQDLSNYKSAIESYEKYLELSGGSKAAAMHNIGKCHKTLGNITEAFEWHEKEMEEKEAAGASPCDIASTLNSIAVRHQDQQKFEKALEVYSQARAKLKEAQDTKRKKELLSYIFNNEGICYRALGQLDKAQEAHRQSRIIKEEIGASSKSVAASISNISAVLSDQGEYQKAFEKYKEALEKKKEHYGQEANHVDIAKCLLGCGSTLMNLKKHEEAEDYLMKARTMQKAVFGASKHLCVAHTLQLLGQNYYEQENFPRAKEYLEEAREAVEGCQDHSYLSQASVKKAIDELLEKVA